SQQEPIAVVLVCDDKYVRHAATTIISIVKNSQRTFCFYIFDCGIRPENIEKLKAWDLGINKINIIPMPKIEIFESFKMRQRYSPAIFYRLAIPEILPNLDKAIYMDSDMIVLDDLGEVWDIPMQDCTFGAVSNESNPKDKALFITRKRVLGITPETIYFNSGFLLFNIRAIKEFHLAERVIHFLEDNTHNQRVTLPDQDALNVVIDRTKFLALPLKFNCDVNGSWRKAGVEKPCVLHLFDKVWKYPPCFVEHFLKKVHPYCDKYFRYARMTPWASEVTRDASLWEVFRCLWKLCLKPIEQFVRYHIRDKFINFTHKN
ncbi:MAG: glycosyltransferase family 8 protein, partial [bacterium]